MMKKYKLLANEDSLVIVNEYILFIKLNLH